MIEQEFRKKGSFKIPNRYLVKLPMEILAPVFAQVVVVRAECLFAEDAVHYVGYSSSFREVDEGCVAPLYIAEFDHSGEEARFVGFREAGRGDVDTQIKQD